MQVGDWRRYVAPAAFLLGVTVAVLLVRAGLESGGARKAATTRRTATAPLTIVVHNRTTPTARRKSRPAAAKKYWTVQAGDTFGAISAATGVPVATIEQLNPNVSSSSLVIGEKVRIR